MTAAAGLRCVISAASQVGKRVDWAAGDAQLEVQMIAEAVAGAADVADEVALGQDAARWCGAETRLVGVAGGDPPAVVEAGVVAVAADPALGSDPAGGGGVDRGSRWDCDIDPGVQ